MNIQDDLEEFRTELRAEVCSRCIERRPGAPPCAPLGIGCGIERHLPALVAMCRTTDSALIDPYVKKLHDSICADCEYKDKPACPCPLDYLLSLAVQAVEAVESRRANCGNTNEVQIRDAPRHNTKLAASVEGGHR